VTLLFEAFDRKGKSLGTFMLKLTSEPARTCIDGNWFKATPISSDLKVWDLAQWWSDSTLAPTYQIAGRLLTVELNGGRLCDDYPEVRAELSDGGAHGVFESGGIVHGAPYGEVVISRVPASPPTGGTMTFRLPPDEAADPAATLEQAKRYCERIGWEFTLLEPRGSFSCEPRKAGGSTAK